MALGASDAPFKILCNRCCSGAAIADLTARIKNTFWFDHRTDLPQWLSSGIAQTVVEWAVLEKELEIIIRILTDGEVEHTRILLFKTNARTRISIIKSLIESQILRRRLRRSDKVKFGKIAKQIGDVANHRNLVAHSVWTKRRNSWRALQTRDSRAIPELKPTLESLSRATLPQAIKITRAKIRSYCAQTVKVSRRLEAIGNRFERALGPLRHTAPQYSRLRPNYRHLFANKTPEATPRSSRA